MQGKKMRRGVRYSLVLLMALFGHQTTMATTHDFWKSATVYFLLPDRFANGDSTNDYAYGRPHQPALLRGFSGGDLRGVIDQLENNYFKNLGVDAIWMTPIFEQIHGVDTSSGNTYAYHGYWPKDFTNVDANFGTHADFKRLVELAHSQGIRILFDVIINHTGPQTALDPAWPDDWVRTAPICNWSSYEQNTRCALASSLTDIRTESTQQVDLPEWLKDKWHKEGRLVQELAELDAYFARTGHPRVPKYYLIKWLTDWVRDYGIDGFRVDTAKHVEAPIWAELKAESELALQEWRQNHAQRVAPDLPFYMVGEVMNWGLLGFKNAVQRNAKYDFGDRQVDYFAHGFDALINMGFAEHLKQPTGQLFEQYAQSLSQMPMQQYGVLNYIGSHDDHDSFDRERKRPFDSAFKLLMAPGGAQIYYGDELARPMLVEGAQGDAAMRAMMNWADLAQFSAQALLSHWQKLGQFRQQFRAIGAGQHTTLSSLPLVFSRTLAGHPAVIVAEQLPLGVKAIEVGQLFADGTLLRDHYSGAQAIVTNGAVTIDSEYSYALLAQVTAG